MFGDGPTVDPAGAMRQISDDCNTPNGRAKSGPLSGNEAAHLWTQPEGLRPSR